MSALKSSSYVFTLTILSTLSFQAYAADMAMNLNSTDWVELPAQSSDNCAGRVRFFKNGSEKYLEVQGSLCHEMKIDEKSFELTYATEDVDRDLRDGYGTLVQMVQIEEGRKPLHIELSAFDNDLSQNLTVTPSVN